MEIDQSEKNGIVCIAVRGRIEGAQTAELEKIIQKIINSDRKYLLFDLEALEYLRSSGLRLILNAVKEINHKNGRVVLCSLNGYIKEIFEINCFKDTLTIADSLESGLKMLSRALKAA